MSYTIPTRIQVISRLADALAIETKGLVSSLALVAAELICEILTGLFDIGAGYCALKSIKTTAQCDLLASIVTLNKSSNLQSVSNLHL